jgi:hypothetical protein
MRIVVPRPDIEHPKESNSLHFPRFARRGWNRLPSGLLRRSNGGGRLPARSSWPLVSPFLIRPKRSPRRSSFSYTGRFRSTSEPTGLFRFQPRAHTHPKRSPLPVLPLPSGERDNPPVDPSPGLSPSGARGKSNGILRTNLEAQTKSNAENIFAPEIQRPAKLFHRPALRPGGKKPNREAAPTGHVAAH